MEAIEQALYGVAPGRGYGFLAVSAGFAEAWRGPAEELCTTYGEPSGVTFPGALFALPLVSGQVAIVEVRDQGSDDQGRPGALAFRILAVPVRVYEHVGADPFWIAEQCPVDWAARDSLASFSTLSLPPPRTIATLRPFLQRDESPFLLGGVQALLDGSRVFIPRARPEPDLVRGLWTLLPTSSRADLWPCTFTFRPRPEFHIQVAPPGEEIPPGSLTESQAMDYPEGRYESALQVAVETNDEPEVARLLARRSRKQMLGIAWLLLALFAIVPIASALIPLSKEEPSPPRIERPTFPPAEPIPPLSEQERRELAKRLHVFGQQRGIPLPAGDSLADLTRQLEVLDEKLPTNERARVWQRREVALFIAQVWGEAAGARQCRLPDELARLAAGSWQLRSFPSVSQQLRVLLWKQGDPDYAKPGPNTLELLEKLEERLK
jgi:hypothetical protein